MWTRNKTRVNASGARTHKNPTRIGAAILTTLCAAISLYGGSLRADPTGTTIYLYDSNGAPVNVTSQYSYHDQHVFDRYGNPIGAVDSASYINNASNQHIGYITYLD